MPDPELNPQLPRPPSDPSEPAPRRKGFPQHQVKIKEQRLATRTKYLADTSCKAPDECKVCEARSAALIDCLRARDPGLSAGDYNEFYFFHPYEGEELAPEWTNLDLKRYAGGEFEWESIADGERALLGSVTPGRELTLNPPYNGIGSRHSAPGDHSAAAPSSVPAPGLPEHHINIREQRIGMTIAYSAHTSCRRLEGCEVCKARCVAFIASLPARVRERERDPNTDLPVAAGDYTAFGFFHAREGEELAAEWTNLDVKRYAGGEFEWSSIADGERALLASGEAAKGSGWGCVVQ